MHVRSAGKIAEPFSHELGLRQAMAPESKTPRRGLTGTVGKELRAHAPFTLVGALTGIAIIVCLSLAHVPRSVAVSLFWGFHPLHVLLSALVTAGMYRLHSHGRLWATVLIGYFGSIGIATLSDCVIPYLGEALLALPSKQLHLGFIEKWWLVNPLALTGIAIAYWWPRTKFSHAGHVLLSTWASLFHMAMALDGQISLYMATMVLVFLFLSVWIPCCVSDIVFPLMFADVEGHHRIAKSAASSDKARELEGKSRKV